MRAFLLALAVALCAPPVVAQEADPLTPLVTGDDAAGWEAVGRIDIDGKGFCTGALIAPDLVLTAAHCLFDRGSGEQIGAERFQFLAGYRNGRALYYRDVRRAVPHPAYALPAEDDVQRSAYDLALLELSQPILSTQVRPFEVLPDAEMAGEVAIVSYAFDRAEAPSLQQLCDVLGAQDSLYVMACDVDFGSSGAPVFRLDDGVARIVSVISAKAEYEGERVAIGTMLDLPLATLRAELTSGGALEQGSVGNITVLRPGERNDTGARFVTP
jgi:protease YdgD